MKTTTYFLTFILINILISSCNNEDKTSCEYTSKWFADTDRDGFGDPENFIEVCIIMKMSLKVT